MDSTLHPISGSAPQPEPPAVAAMPVPPEPQDWAYLVRLPQFEGPFDLLLFFIQRDELDIYDIPIHDITRNFLDYIHTMDRLQISVAAEFIYMAAQLMKIKAKMLIPRPQLDEKGEAIDPRTDLVQRLMEYKLYKEAANALEQREAEQALRLKRGYTQAERAFLREALEDPADDLMNLNLYAIMRTYQRVMEKHLREVAKPRHVIRALPYTMDQVRDNIMLMVQDRKRVDFLEVALAIPEPMYVVFCFLNILEMTQQRLLHLTLGEGYN
ncbi:MAG: segregation and condensation protein A, partial [Sphingobacteriia bacterium]